MTTEEKIVSLQGDLRHKIKLGFVLPGGQVVHLPPELTRLQRIERYRELVELFHPKQWDRIEDTP